MVMAVLLIWVEWVVTNTIAFQYYKKVPFILEGTFFIAPAKKLWSSLLCHSLVPQTYVELLLRFVGLLGKMINWFNLRADFCHP
jgi:hypothetical protein